MQDSAEVKKLAKKDIMDFTENLERVLLNAYNATKPTIVAAAPEAMEGMSEEQKAAEQN